MPPRAWSGVGHLQGGGNPWTVGNTLKICQLLARIHSLSTMASPPPGASGGSPGGRRLQPGDAEAVTNALRRLGMEHTARGRRVKHFIDELHEEQGGGDGVGVLAPQPETQPSGRAAHAAGENSEGDSLGRRVQVSGNDLNALSSAMKRLGVQDQAEGRRIASWMRRQELRDSIHRSIQSMSSPGALRPTASGQPTEEKGEMPSFDKHTDINDGAQVTTSSGEPRNRAHPLLEYRPSLPRALPLVLEEMMPRGQVIKGLVTATTGALIDRVPVVVVCGCAGSGKTAVASELVRRIAEHGRQQAHEPRGADQLVLASAFIGEEHGVLDVDDISGVHDGADVVAEGVLCKLREQIAAQMPELGLTQDPKAQDLEADLADLLLRVLHKGKSICVVLDGLPAPHILKAATAALSAHRSCFLDPPLAETAAVGGAGAAGGGGKGRGLMAGQWHGRPRLQCVVMAEGVPLELEPLKGYLVREVGLPALSLREKQAVRQVWMDALKVEKNKETSARRERNAPGLAGLRTPRDIVVACLGKAVQGRASWLDEEVRSNDTAGGDGWAKVVGLVEGKIGPGRVSAVAEALLWRRPVSARTISDARWFWPFVWARPLAVGKDGAAGSQGSGGRSGADRDDADADSDTDRLVRKDGSHGATGAGESVGLGAERQSDSSGDEEEEGGAREGGVLCCGDVGLWSLLLDKCPPRVLEEAWPRCQGGAEVARGAKEVDGDGWEVRVVTAGSDAAVQAGEASESLEVEGAVKEQGYGGERTSARLVLYWSRPASAVAAREMAASLAQALVDTGSVALVETLTKEVVAALLSSSDMEERRDWLHHVRGFEAAVLSAARGRAVAAGAHARIAAADLPWVKRARLRGQARGKMTRALARLRGVTGLLSIKAPSKGPGMAGGVTGLRLIGAGARAAGAGAGTAGRGGVEFARAGEQERVGERAGLWAAAEAKRRVEEERALLAWKGKVGIEALLLALGAGFGGGGDRLKEGACAGAWKVMAGALCAISGAHLYAVGAAGGLKAALLRNALLPAVLRAVPADVRVTLVNVVGLMPAGLCPPIPWRTAGGDPRKGCAGRVGAASVTEDVLQCGAADSEGGALGVDELLSCVYVGNAGAVREWLKGAGEKRVAAVTHVSELWGTSPLHAAAALASSGAGSIAAVAEGQGDAVANAVEVLRLLLGTLSTPQTHGGREGAAGEDGPRGRNDRCSAPGQKPLGASAGGRSSRAECWAWGWRQQHVRGGRPGGKTEGMFARDSGARGVRGVVEVCGEVVETKGRGGVVDVLNAAGVPASAGVAGGLWFRVKRLVCVRRAVLRGDGGGGGSWGLLDALEQDEKCRRIQLVLRLLLEAGADLMLGSARLGRTMGDSGSAAAVLMPYKCDTPVTTCLCGCCCMRAD